MISKNKFDCFIKKNLVDVIGNDCFGYEIEDKSYDVYYNKEAIINLFLKYKMVNIINFIISIIMVKEAN